MDKLKNPKTIGLILSVLLGIALATFANLKPFVAEVCAQACPQVELKD